MSRKRVIMSLKASFKCIGRPYPILLDKHGNIMDGRTVSGRMRTGLK